MICGIVDLGSNTIRLSVYQWEGVSFKRLLDQKAMAGLAGYVKGGVLSEEGIMAACRVLSGYRALLDNFEIGDMHVFATASLRNVSNTDQAVEAIRAVTGITVEVLSGDEEAQLSFRGAVLPGGVDTGLLADIGGGSFELVSYESMSITSACSVPMGSLSLYTRQVAGLFPTGDERRAMKSLVAGALDEAATAGLKRDYLCGVGGTIRAVSKLANDVFRKDPDCRTFSAGEAKELYKRLKKGDKETLVQILHTVPDRVHTILPGLIILNTILKTYGVETVAASNSGVREGYLLDRVMGI